MKKEKPRYITLNDVIYGGGESYGLEKSIRPLTQVLYVCIKKDPVNG